LGVPAIEKQNKCSGKRGPKCRYKPDYHSKMIKWMCRAGATDDEIARELGILVRQLYRWYREYPELCQAKTEGKKIPDSEVEQSLRKRALGYEVEEGEVVATNGQATKVKKKRKHIPADIRACRLWLMNRDPENWRWH